MATRAEEFLETAVAVIPIASKFDEQPIQSRYFSLGQLTFADEARKKSINNNPSARQIENL